MEREGREKEEMDTEGRVYVRYGSQVVGRQGKRRGRRALGAKEEEAELALHSAGGEGIGGAVQEVRGHALCRLMGEDVSNLSPYHLFSNAAP